MSVDTNVKGKNLLPYKKLRQDGFEIYVSPTLIGLVESMRVSTGGVFGGRLVVELRGVADGSCR